MPYGYFFSTFVLSSTGQWKHVHYVVETRPQASGNTSTCGLTILVVWFNDFS